MEQLRVELIAALAEAGRLASLENPVSEPYKTRYEAREVLVSTLRAFSGQGAHLCATYIARWLNSWSLGHFAGVVVCAAVNRSFHSAPS